MYQLLMSHSSLPHILPPLLPLLFFYTPILLPSEEYERSRRGMGKEMDRSIGEGEVGEEWKMRGRGVKEKWERNVDELIGA